MFDQIFVKLAGNQDSHKISNELEFWPDWTIHFGVTCPWVPKKPIFDLVRCIVPSILFESSSIMQVTKTGIKSQGSSNLGQIGIFALELLALEWRTINSHRLIIRSIATSFFYQIFLMLAGNEDFHKIFDEFDFGPYWTIHFGVTRPWATKKFSATFDCIIFKLAGNQEISDEFKFQPDRTFHFRVTCPSVPKNTIFDLVRSIACLVLIRSLWDLHIIWTSIKSRMSSLARSDYWFWSYLPFSALLIAPIDL